MYGLSDQDEIAGSMKGSLAPDSLTFMGTEPVKTVLP